MIVTGDFTHTLHWPAGLPAGEEVTFIMDDVEPQDGTYLVIKDIAPVISIQGGTQVFTIQALRAASTTSWLLSGNDLLIHYVGINKRVNIAVTR